MRTLLLLLFLTSSSLVHAQVYDKTDFYNDAYDRSYIKENRIKSIDFEILNSFRKYIERYNFDQDGFIQKITYQSNDTIHMETSFQRNNEFCIRTMHSPTGTFDTHSDTFLYENGKLIRETYLMTIQLRFKKEDPGTSEKYIRLVGIKTHTYNYKGAITRTVNTVPQFRGNSTLEIYEYRYDEAGKLVESKHLRDDGEIEQRLLSHRLISYKDSKILKEDEQVLFKKDSYDSGYRNTYYNYNDCGQLISIQSDKPTPDAQFEYNPRGLIIKVKSPSFTELLNYTFW